MGDFPILQIYHPRKRFPTSQLDCPLWGRLDFIRKMRLDWPVADEMLKMAAESYLYSKSI